MRSKSRINSVSSSLRPPFGAPVRALKSPAARLCAALRKRVTGLVIDHARR